MYCLVIWVKGVSLPRSRTTTPTPQTHTHTPFAHTLTPPQTQTPQTRSYEFDKWRADRARLQRLRRENRVQELRAFEPRSLVFYPFVLTPAVKVGVWFPCGGRFPFPSLPFPLAPLPAPKTNHTVSPKTYQHTDDDE